MNARQSFILAPWLVNTLPSLRKENMKIIIQDDGVFKLVDVTKKMLADIKIFANDLDCFDLCDIIRLKLATYSDNLNQYFMNDGSGYFYGCMCI